MTCNHCAASAEQALYWLAGVRATVSLEKQQAEIASEGQSSTDAMVKSIEDQGYGASVVDSDQPVELDLQFLGNYCIFY